MRSRARALASLLVGALVAGVTPGALAGEAIDPGSAIDYSERGPHDVGVATLPLGDRSVEVFYPSVDDPDGPAADYRPAAALSASVRAALPELLDTTVEVDATVGATPSDLGPFPVVLHSHGLGSDRHWSSRHLAHLASWGLVAAAPDQRNLGLEAATTGVGRDAAPGTERRVLAATLDLLTRATIQRGHPLEGVIDTERVGVEGLDAGGAAALAFADDPQVDVVVGLAPGAPVPFTPDDPLPLSRRLRAVEPPDVPTMIIAVDDDAAIDRTGVIDPLVAWLGDDVGVGVLRGTGHSVFLDNCSTLREAGGLGRLVEDVEAPIDPRLVALRSDGCDSSDDADPAIVRAVVDHLSVARYLSVLGSDQDGAIRSLDADVVADRFDDLLASYSAPTG